MFNVFYSVQVHLVVSVGEHSYLALPRGGIADTHVLVAPIDCVPSRVHLSAGKTPCSVAQ